MYSCKFDIDIGKGWLLRLKECGNVKVTCMAGDDHRDEWKLLCETGMDSWRSYT